jgi:hypothetical protein
VVIILDIEQQQKKRKGGEREKEMRASFFLFWPQLFFSIDDVCVCTYVCM